MKKILFLLLCLPFYMSSQNKLYVTSYNSNDLNDILDNCPYVYPYNENYWGEIYLYYDYSYDNGEYDILNNQLPLNIKIECHSAYDSCPPGTNCGGSLCCQEDEYGTPLDVTLNLFDEIYLNEGSLSCEGFGSALPELNYSAILIPKLLQPNENTRCKNELLFSQYQDGINHNVVGLDWKYLNNNNDWVSFPQEFNDYNRYPLNVTLEDIFGENADLSNYFTGILRLKFTFSASFSSTILLSDIVNFQVIDCSPQLIENSFLTDDTSCSYTNDGGFSMKLDRNLNSDETLIVSLFFEDVNNPGSYGIIGQQATSSLIDNGDGTYTFIWNTITDGIEAGNYKVKYQTCNGCSSIPNSDSSWDSLVYSNSFTVGNPPPVLIEGLSYNVACKGENNGKIDLQVNGGTSPYFYNIKIEGAPWLENNWVQFTSGNTHTINNLSSANYKVRIKDSNGCEQQ